MPKNLKRNQFFPKSAIFDCMKTGDAEIAHKTWNRMKTEPSKLTYQFTTPYFPKISDYTANRYPPGRSHGFCPMRAKTVQNVL